VQKSCVAEGVCLKGVMDAPSVSHERVSEQQGDFGTVTQRIDLSIYERWRLKAGFADHADMAWQRYNTAAKPHCGRYTFGSDT
jgi:hypothetical protein